MEKGGVRLLDRGVSVLGRSGLSGTIDINIFLSGYWGGCVCPSAAMGFSGLWVTMGVQLW